MLLLHEICTHLGLGPAMRIWPAAEAAAISQWQQRQQRCRTAGRLSTPAGEGHVSASQRAHSFIDLLHWVVLAVRSRLQACAIKNCRAETGGAASLVAWQMHSLVGAVCDGRQQRAGCMSAAVMAGDVQYKSVLEQAAAHLHCLLKPADFGTHSHFGCRLCAMQLLLDPG